MISIRKSVFETNSSSTHSLTYGNTPIQENYYHLTDSGYVLVEFGNYYFEFDKVVYNDLNSKLNFIMTLIYEFELWKIHQIDYRITNVPKEEFKKNKYVQEINNILRNSNIPNCKGIRFKKNIFKGEEPDTIYRGSPSFGLDTHHFQECNTFEQYLRKNSITLERLLLDPKIGIAMNYN